MEITARVGRNEPCPCGSGKKFKNCCEGVAVVAPEAKRSPLLLVGVIVVGLAIAGLVAMRTLGDAEPVAQSGPATPVAPFVLPTAPPHPLAAGGPAPQPPGPVPLGKVWSVEHGHWHDAPGASSPNAPPPIALDAAGNALPGALTPQPPGPVPEGKVWSPEHGHWHDAAPGAVVPQ